MDFFTELGIPFLAFILFFTLQSSRKLSEKTLTLVVIAITALTGLLSYHHNEWVLFGIGLLIGILIEIVMRRLGYQQVWKDASLWGTPYWLPLMWGFGFVIITRLGLFVLSL